MPNFREYSETLFGTRLQQNGLNTGVPAPLEKQHVWSPGPGYPKIAIRGDGAILEVMGSKRPPLWGLIDVLLMLSSHMLGKPH